MAGKMDGLQDYVEVNTRIMKFYEKYPEGRILTEILEWKDGVVVMKATVYRDSSDVIAATGHAYEKEGSSFINKTSALENCETSACGRALAMLGFEIKKSIASKEEIANAILNQSQGSTKGNNFNQRSNQQNNKNLTEAQINRLKAISKAAGYSIDKLISMIKQKYNKKPEELTREEYEHICNSLEKK